MLWVYRVLFECYFQVMTYNAALVGASISKFDTTIPDNRVERRDALISYLNDDAHADIVCLQEVFIFKIY
jgi:hypothetical protein